MTPTEKHRERAGEIYAFVLNMADDRDFAIRNIISVLNAVEREGMKRAAEIVASYPPDGFFDLLKGATESSDPVYELHLFEGDGGNWAWLMSVLLQPYVSAILSEAGESV